MDEADVNEKERLRTKIECQQAKPETLYIYIYSAP